MALISVPNLQATEWGLFTHHLSKWGAATLPEKIQEIFLKRVPNAIELNYHFLFFGFMVFAIFFVIPRSKIHPAFKFRSSDFFLFIVFIVGLGFFGASNLVAGEWFFEYEIPVLGSLLPLLSIATARLLALQRDNYLAKCVVGIAFVTMLSLSLIRNGTNGLSWCGDQSPLQGIKSISSFVAHNSEPTDKIIALEALWVAVDSGRLTLPGLTMAQVSYQTMEKRQAETLHLVTGEILLDYISNKKAKIIVLTDVDRQMFESTGYDERIHEMLEKNYQLKRMRYDFGQKCNTVYVYSN